MTILQWETSFSKIGYPKRTVPAACSRGALLSVEEMQIKNLRNILLYSIWYKRIILPFFFIYLNIHFGQCVVKF